MEKPAVATSNAREEQTARRRYDPNDKFYKSGPWPKLSQVMRRLNPVCQRILNAGLYKNEQCHNASALTHHIVSPKQRPELALVPANLICLCEHCHPTEQGTPGWVVGKDYVATVLPHWGTR